MTDYEPGFILDQALGCALHQDYLIDFDDAYDALEDWFVQVDGAEVILTALIRDLDLLFADEPDAAARLAHFPEIGWRVETFDDFLSALRRRAETGLAGNPEPMLPPWT